MSSQSLILDYNEINNSEKADYICSDYDNYYKSTDFSEHYIKSLNIKINDKIYGIENIL